MDFQISNQRQFDLRLKEFLDYLKARDYSETTVNGYKSFLKKAWTYISQAGSSNTLKTSQVFGYELTLGPPLSGGIMCCDCHILGSNKQFEERV